MRGMRVLAMACLGAALAASLTGCQRLRHWNWRGAGYDPEVNELTSDYRPPADEKQFMGLDQRARDIERNLGVR